MSKFLFPIKILIPSPETTLLFKMKWHTPGYYLLISAHVVVFISLMSSHEQIPFPNHNPDPKPRNYSSVRNEMTYPRLLLLSSTEFDWPWWDNVGHRWDRWGCRRRRRATGRRRRPAGWPLGTRPHRCRRFAPSGASARAATAWWCSTPAWRRAALTNHKPFGQGGGQWAIFGKIGWWSVSTVHKI